MSQRSTLKAIAHRVGISISTVSRVLNESPNTRVAAETRRRIWQTARELSYRRYPLQLRFVSGTPSREPGAFQRLPVIAEAQREAERRQLTLPLVFADSTVEAQQECIGRMADAGVDGLLIVTRLHPEVREQLVRLRMPAVFVGSALRDPRFTCVHSDNEQGTLLLMDHLHALGHRRVAFCGGSRENYYEDQRHRSYQSACLRAGFVPPEGWSFWTRAERGALDDWLDGLMRLPRAEYPTAILADSHATVRPVLAHLARRGHRIPDEFSVVVFDDPVASEPDFPPVTCVRRPVEALSCLGVARLLEELANPELPRVRMILPVELIVRQTSGPPPREDVIALPRLPRCVPAVATVP